MLRFLLLNLIAASLMFGLAKSFRGSYSGRSSRIGSIVLRPRSLLLRRDLTVNVLVVGKKNSVERWIQDGVSEFEKRLVPVMNLNTQFLKSNDALLDAVKKSKGCSMAMDERGKTLTSVEFSTLVQKSMEEGGATVNFIIGAADGLPDEIKQDPKINKISLSQMTFTHQMARLLLIEQIYRATEIQKGSGYHKD